MDYIERDLAPFIEERLQILFNNLKKSKDYKQLQTNYNTLLVKLSNCLKNNIRNI